MSPPGILHVGGLSVADVRLMFGLQSITPHDYNLKNSDHKADNSQDALSRKPYLAILLLHGTWNKLIACDEHRENGTFARMYGAVERIPVDKYTSKLANQLKQVLPTNENGGSNNLITLMSRTGISTILVGSILVDQPSSFGAEIGEELVELVVDGQLKCPDTLPVLAVIAYPKNGDGARVCYLRAKLREMQSVQRSPTIDEGNTVVEPSTEELVKVMQSALLDMLQLKRTAMSFGHPCEASQKPEKQTSNDFLSKDEAGNDRTDDNRDNRSLSNIKRQPLSPSSHEFFVEGSPDMRNKSHADASVREPNGNENEDDAIRIFIAGDRSQVGKSSICMGLLGSLLQLGYPPNKLAYIKPATQCEAPQLVTAFCEHRGIKSCVPVGPIVYYKGFTREFLAGRTETREELLSKAAMAVDDIAIGKDVVIVDGVGYPAVGSICGTSNANVALVCGQKLAVAPLHHVEHQNDDSQQKHTRNEQWMRRYPAPVLLVGKSGVGDAIDSFNLNSTYFEANGIPIIGSVFNRLPIDGYYSIENCRTAITEYFNNRRTKEQRAFGFIPEVGGIASSRQADVDSNPSNASSDALSKADEFVKVFMEHVDVRGILDAARKVSNYRRGTKKLKTSNEIPLITEPTASATTAIQEKLSIFDSAKKPIKNRSILTREQIESSAMAAGAASG